MKILKIFGIVVGIHIFALVLIFANPGCSSTSKPAPAPSDTVAPTSAVPAVNPPGSPSPAYAATSEPPPSAAAPLTFNPDAPAMAVSSTNGGSVRFSPTRPGTPVAGAIVSEPVLDVTPVTTYAVKPGESLWSIAKKNHLTTAELAVANGLSTTAVLKPGQKLKIPGKSASPPAAAMAKGGAGPTTKAGEAGPAAALRSSSPEGVKHKVKTGETLGSIARIYGVKQGDIAVANNISDPAKIKADMELTIPGWQTPPSKSGKNGGKSGAGPKAGEPKPVFIIEQSPAQPPAGPPPVPIIKIDDTPISPAPKP